MLFADDIVLVDESTNGVNAKLKRWREAIKSKVFKIRRTKTKYMDYKFSGHLQRAETTVKFDSR